MKRIPMNEVLEFVPINIRTALDMIPEETKATIEEIRLRLGSPLLISGADKEFFISSLGNITKELKDLYYIKRDDINRASELIQNFSVYSYSEELKNGYITIPGGHRIGISGRTIVENSNIKSIKDIAFINYRIAREILGAGDKVIKHIISKPNNIYNTLIISPPQCGKTTLLRDLIRQISNGFRNFNFKGKKIALIDERSEIAACYMGEPRNDVGIRTDIMDACPKAKGIMMMIRSMSPEIIATDEIGKFEDAEALHEAVNAGVKVITTMHGNSTEDLYMKIELKKIHSNFFERIIVLSRNQGVGTIDGIYDEKGRTIYPCSLLRDRTCL